MNDVVRLEVPLVGPEGYDPAWDDYGRLGLYYDRKGNRLTLREWASLWEWDPNYRIVKQEYVESYWISTVLLGIDHNFGLGSPIIFETMVFNHAYDEPPSLGTTPPDNYPEYTSSTDLDCRRYATEEEAIAGHEQMVAEVRLMVEATKKED